MPSAAFCNGPMPIPWCGVRGPSRPNIALRCQPRRILAVRGPLSRELCLRNGVDCPAIHGDPALLMPAVYRPAGRIRHGLGIIPHYVDQDTAFIARCRAAGLTVINVSAEIESFVNQVVGCAGILSSSLHGLICADAYGVPSRWIRISDRVLGDGFKFRDYYASQGVEEEAIGVDAGVDLRRLDALPASERAASIVRRCDRRCWRTWKPGYEDYRRAVRSQRGIVPRRGLCTLGGLRHPVGRHRQRFDRPDAPDLREAPCRGSCTSRGFPTGASSA